MHCVWGSTSSGPTAGVAHVTDLAPGTSEHHLRLAPEIEYSPSPSSANGGGAAGLGGGEEGGAGGAGGEGGDGNGGGGTSSDTSLKAPRSASRLLLQARVASEPVAAHHRPLACLKV